MVCSVQQMAINVSNVHKVFLEVNKHRNKPTKSVIFISVLKMKYIVGQKEGISIPGATSPCLYKGRKPQINPECPASQAQTS